jgi:hypothetical protein
MRQMPFGNKAQSTRRRRRIALLFGLAAPRRCATEQRYSTRALSYEASG